MLDAPRPAPVSLVLVNHLNTLKRIYQREELSKRNATYQKGRGGRRRADDTRTIPVARQVNGVSKHTETGSEA
jgi:hypothetical protein